MGSNVTSPRIRARLARPLPEFEGATNSSQVRRLIAKLMSPPSDRGRSFASSRQIAISLLLALTFGILTIISYRIGLLGRASKSAVPLSSVTEPQAIEPTLTRHFSGTIGPARKSELAFARSGRIKQVLVKEGQVVEAGSVLAELDTELIQAELSIARSELKLTMTKGLPKSTGWPSVRRIYPSHVDNSPGDANRLLHEHWSTIIKQLELQLELCKLRAPYRGMITHINLFDGSVYTADQSVMNIVSHEEMTAKISLPARYATRLKDQDKFSLLVGEYRQQAELQGIVPDASGSPNCTAFFRLDGLTSADTNARVTLRLSLPAEAKQ